MMGMACALWALVAGIWILWPLFGRADNDATAAAAAPDGTFDMGADYLLARKAALYRNIKDLEFEYKLGRLDGADFQQLAAAYKSEAVEILQKLDRLNATKRPGAIPAGPAESAGLCPACGAKIIPGKKFCADCGARLDETA